MTLDSKTWDPPLVSDTVTAVFFSEDGVNHVLLGKAWVHIMIIVSCTNYQEIEMIRRGSKWLKVQLLKTLDSKKATINARNFA